MPYNVLLAQIQKASFFQIKLSSVYPTCFEAIHNHFSGYFFQVCDFQIILSITNCQEFTDTLSIDHYAHTLLLMVNN